MNFASHIVVAHRSAERPTTALLLGAAAPDLVRMARLPVATDGPPDFIAGVRTHHRTDAAFHELAWFRRRCTEVTGALTSEGVRRGPARGAAHVLIELLLDGVLLGRDDEAAVFGTAWDSLRRGDADARAMVAPDDHEPWLDFLERLTDRLEPVAYLDPGYAADRTAGTLNRRPRLALTDDEHAAVRSLAPQVQPTVVDDADEVVASVLAVLR